MLLARAGLAPDRVVDVRLADGVVTTVDDRLRPSPDEDVLDLRGHVVLPGLHDHHLHLRAAAAAASSVDAGAIADETALRAALRDAAEGRPPGAWLRVVGYHESIAGDLDRATLDRLGPPGHPVRVQHRTGALWVLNSAALTAAGLESSEEPGVDPAAGHLWRRDDLLARISTLDPTSLTDLGDTAAARGVTGFTDATPFGSATAARDLANDLRAAGVRQHLHLMGPVGAVPPQLAGTSLGPVKVLLDDDDLPPLDGLTDIVRAAHHERRPVAVHCVTRVQLVVALAALEAAGSVPGDRIEHGSVIPAELIPTIAALGLTVVTQPHFVAERGDDYRRDVDPDDVDSLYRIRSLQDAGVPVAAGTDAPFGSPDPWASVAAAMERRTPSGPRLGAAEGVGLASALGLYLGRADAPGTRRRIEVGAPADLCVLAVPWRDLADAVAHGRVSHTFITGEPVHPQG